MSHSRVKEAFVTEHRITGKNVLIAGGAKNLGGLIARDLASQGAKAIAIHYNSDATKSAADDTAAAIKSAGSSAYTFQGDLTSALAVRQLFNDAKDTMGSIDIAINTAGRVIRKPIADITEEEVDAMFAINAKTAFFFIQQAGKHLSDGGKIITLVTSLLAAFTGNYSIYAGSKSPVEHFTRAASREFGERGISVTAVAPGPMETPFFYGQETEESAKFNQQAADLSKFTNTGLTDPNDIVPIVRLLAGEGWWITGQTIFPNGGYTTR
jgi:NAD(P)-dependent dehydrogenase (short-subunit alcohol dehydrogenase family)